MAQLLPGVNINDGVIRPAEGIMQNLLDKAFNLDLIANTNYSNAGAHQVSFILPVATPLDVKDKTDAVTDGNDGIEYKWAQASEQILKLNKYVQEGRQIATCPAHQVSPELAAASLATLANQWTNARVNEAVYKLYNGTQFTPEDEDANILEIIEDMIVSLENLGFERHDLTIALSAEKASEARKLGLDAQSLKDFNVTTNLFEVKSVVNMGARFASMGIGVAVYVKDYLLAGANCNREPEMYTGSEKFRGRTLLSGEMEFGSELVKLGDITPAVIYSE